MGSASSLRNELYLQGAATAVYGLARSDGGVWAVLTMAVAAGAVFLGAAVQPTAALRTAVLAFEGVAVAVGLAGLLAGHYLPGTLLGVVVLIQLSGAGSRSGGSLPALSLYGAPVASPFDYPAMPPQEHQTALAPSSWTAPEGVAPPPGAVASAASAAPGVPPGAAGPPTAPAAAVLPTAPPAMTILPG